MQVQDIYNLNEGIAGLIDKEIPVGAAFKLQRINKKVADELESAEKLRSKILEKYKDGEAENGRVKIKKDKTEDFQQEINELMSQEVDVELDKIDISSLGDVSVAPRTMALLDSIVDAE